MVARSLFAGLVDDAALFPPGNAPMERALAEHAEHRASPYADVVGPFLCPASRVGELTATLAGEQELSLSLVFDVTGDEAHSALRTVAADPRLRLVGVEAAYARLGDDAATVGGNLARLPGVTGFLEVPQTGFDPALDLVGAGWAAAKYRTGGTTPDAFPSEAQLAAFLVSATGRGVAFKLTAGLHHAVRHTGEGTGFGHHGVLNVLVATRAAARGASAEAVSAVLAERSPATLVAEVGAWSEDACMGVRAAFRSFGCCGVTDPIDDLYALRLLEGGHA